MPFRNSQRFRQFAAGAALASAVIVSERASAEIVDAAANGFTLRETAHIAASPDRVYAALATPQRWWSSLHTFSGNAANMSLDAKAGGCWCETLPDGGSVWHMTVVYAAPGKSLRLRGALGPFQAMAVDGVMTWSLKDAGGGTDVTLSNAVGGYVAGGFASMAPTVDGVLGDQLARLRQFLETGSPDNHLESKP